MKTDPLAPAAAVQGAAPIVALTGSGVDGSADRAEAEHSALQRARA